MPVKSPAFRNALRFVKKRGVVLESAQGPVPNIAEFIAGAPIRRSWWTHAKARAIFAVTRWLRDHPDVLVCTLVDGKITYVHRRLWPALVRLATHFQADQLSSINEVHTPSGQHRVEKAPFSDWVPPMVFRQAKKLSEKQAWSRLGKWISPAGLMF